MFRVGALKAQQGLVIECDQDKLFAEVRVHVIKVYDKAGNIAEKKKRTTSACRKVCTIYISLVICDRRVFGAICEHRLQGPK